MPKVIRWIVFIFLAVINGFLVCSVSVGVIKNMYTPVKLLYLGKAEGEWDENFTGSLSTCREYKFYYYEMGYGLITKDTVERCKMHNFDFDLKTDGKQYIYCYASPILKLEYCKNRTTIFGDYYSRAVYDKRDFQEEIYFFYEMEDIPIGTTEMENIPPMLDEEEAYIGYIIYSILFILSIITIVTGRWCFKDLRR